MLVATLDAQLAKTPWQNVDVLMAHLADHPKLLEKKPIELAKELQIPPNMAAAILSSPEIYQKLVAAVLQRTISPQKHGEILRHIADEATNEEQPLGYRIQAAKFVAQQTGVLAATKTAHQEERVFRVLLEHDPRAKEVADVFDSTTRIVDALPEAEPSQNHTRGGDEVVDADFAPTDG